MTTQETRGVRAWKLCEEFEKDIRYDAHSLETRIARSEAGKELVALGEWALAAIFRCNKHRGSTSCSELDREVDAAWCAILADIKRTLDPAGEVPLDVSTWFNWASSHIPIC